MKTSLSLLVALSLFTSLRVYAASVPGITTGITSFAVVTPSVNLGDIAKDYQIDTGQLVVEMEAKLRSLNVPVNGKPPRDAITMAIVGLGVNQDWCAVHIEINIVEIVKLPRTGKEATCIIWTDGGLFSCLKSDAEVKLKTEVDNVATNLANDWLRDNR